MPEQWQIFRAVLLNYIIRMGLAGAARAAGVGCGYYANYSESFRGMEIIKQIEPNQQDLEETASAYQRWKLNLSAIIN